MSRSRSIWSSSSSSRGYDPIQSNLRPWGSQQMKTWSWSMPGDWMEIGNPWYSYHEIFSSKAICRYIINYFQRKFASFVGGHLIIIFRLLGNLTMTYFLFQKKKSYNIYSDGSNSIVQAFLVIWYIECSFWFYKQQF